MGLVPFRVWPLILTLLFYLVYTFNLLQRQMPAGVKFTWMGIATTLTVNILWWVQYTRKCLSFISCDFCLWLLVSLYEYYRGTSVQVGERYISNEELPYFYLNSIEFTWSFCSRSVKKITNSYRHIKDIFF